MRGLAVELNRFARRHGLAARPASPGLVTAYIVVSLAMFVPFRWFLGQSYAERTAILALDLMLPLFSTIFFLMGASAIAQTAEDIARAVVSRKGRQADEPGSE